MASLGAVGVRHAYQLHAGESRQHAGMVGPHGANADDTHAQRCVTLHRSNHAEICP